MMKNYKRIVLAALAVVFVIPVFYSCAPETDKPRMPIEYVKAIADYGVDIKLENLTGYDNEKFIAGDFPLYYFPLEDSRFSLWACYSVDDDMMFYIMLSHDETEEKLYIFHRDPEQILSTELEYEGAANSYDVENFIAKMTEED